ncbi:MAG TPA: hypothetical protein EYO84_09665 [Planctomycetes bacterium]|nr:hypothetical protein [Planctomycetota bacterium]
MKVGDLVKVDYTGPAENGAAWEDFYVGVLLDDSGYHSQQEPRTWKILVTDSEGSGIGTFTADYWHTAVIE